MRLFRLIYSSRAKKILSFSDVKELTSKASEKNKETEITGILLYANNYFFQTIEGSQEEINDLYLRISKDERHGSIRLLSYNNIEKRLFPSWGMGLIQTEPSQDLINRHFENGKFVPTILSPDQSESFLHELKKMFF